MSCLNSFFAALISPFKRKRKRREIPKNSFDNPLSVCISNDTLNKDSNNNIEDDVLSRYAIGRS